MPSIRLKKVDPDMAIVDGATGDGLTVEYRDATISVKTRDTLAELHNLLGAARFRESIGQKRLAALDDVFVLAMPRGRF